MDCPRNKHARVCNFRMKKVGDMKFKLKDNQGITLVVVLMVMAILLSVIGAGLLFSGINTKITANYQLGTKAFYAADMGMSDAVTRIGPDPTVVSHSCDGCSRSFRTDLPKWTSD